MSQQSGPWQPQGLSAQFFPVLRDFSERVFLVHAHLSGNQLSAALLVVDGFIEDGWITVSDTPSLAGLRFDVQLPAEVIGQAERYKGYDVVLPVKPL
jgi:hypothetical protein